MGRDDILVNLGSSSQYIASSEVLIATPCHRGAA